MVENLWLESASNLEGISEMVFYVFVCVFGV